MKAMIVLVCIFEPEHVHIHRQWRWADLMTESPRASVAARRGVRHVGREAGARRLVAAPRRRVTERQVEHLHVVRGGAARGAREVAAPSRATGHCSCRGDLPHEQRQGIHRGRRRRAGAEQQYQHPGGREWHCSERALSRGARGCRAGDIDLAAAIKKGKFHHAARASRLSIYRALRGHVCNCLCMVPPELVLTPIVSS